MQSLIVNPVELACLLEATARKPGNVHRLIDFPDTSYLDFVLSSKVIGNCLRYELIREFGVGHAIEQAVDQTRQVIGRNTNLGIILLLAPMVAVPAGIDLFQGLPSILSRLTVEDAKAAYAAIRIAAPGGLGTATEQEVAAEPTVTLRAAMALAADKDAIARQYDNNYFEVFEIGVATLTGELGKGEPLERAIVKCHLELMACLPDTLIARKCGVEMARESAHRASEVLAAGWPDQVAGRDELQKLDIWLRADGNRRNPGASADLVCAAIYAALRQQRIAQPLDWVRSFSLGDPALAV